MNSWFTRFATWSAVACGTSWAFLLSVLLVVVWAAFGPYFHWSDTHQLFINTATTVITFWMVFVIQHTQNRDSKALHLKLDEIIRSIENARNSFMQAETKDDEQLDHLTQTNNTG